MFCSVCLAVDDQEPRPMVTNRTLPRASRSSLLSTCPNHPNLLLRRASPNTPTPHLLTRHLILFVTPAIYLSILLSHPTTHPQVSSSRPLLSQHNITDLIQASNTMPLQDSSIPLFNNSPEISLHFPPPQPLWL